jgi:hypothetical protein
METMVLILGMALVHHSHSKNSSVVMGVLRWRPSVSY